MRTLLIRLEDHNDTTHRITVADYKVPEPTLLSLRSSDAGHLFLDLIKMLTRQLEREIANNTK